MHFYIYIYMPFFLRSSGNKLIVPSVKRTVRHRKSNPNPFPGKYIPSFLPCWVIFQPAMSVSFREGLVGDQQKSWVNSSRCRLEVRIQGPKGHWAGKHVKSLVPNEEKKQATPLKINGWNIVMEVWKIIFLSKWVICGFHVNLPGCM